MQKERNDKARLSDLQDRSRKHREHREMTHLLSSVAEAALLAKKSHSSAILHGFRRDKTSSAGSMFWSDGTLFSWPETPPAGDDVSIQDNPTVQYRGECFELLNHWPHSCPTVRGQGVLPCSLATVCNAFFSDVAWAPIMGWGACRWCTYALFMSCLALGLRLEQTRPVESRSFAVLCSLVASLC